MRPGGFVEPTDAAPQIHLPERVQRGRSGTGDGRIVRERRAKQIVASAADDSVVIHVRNELGPCLHGDCRSLFNPRHGNSQIIIISQGFADQGLQRFVLINLPPIQIGEGMICSVTVAAENAGRIDGGPVVIGANRTTSQPRCADHGHKDAGVPPGISRLENHGLASPSFPPACGFA